MIEKDFMNPFRKKVKNVEKNGIMVVEVDKKFFTPFKKLIIEYDDSVSGLTRRLWKQFIKNPASLNEHKERLRPKNRKQTKRVTITVSPGLHTKIRETAKIEEYSASHITRKLWKTWFDSHSN